MQLIVTGIDELLAKLKNASNVEEMILDDIRDLMKEAEQIVTTKYSLQGNGNDDFTTSVSKIPNGWELSVSGDDVGFLEFGAGVFTEANEFAEEVSYPVEPGSWSESHEHSSNPNARYFAKNGFWWWSNIRYTGLYPTRGMQEAAEHIRQNILSVIEQRINEWIES